LTHFTGRAEMQLTSQWQSPLTHFTGCEKRKAGICDMSKWMQHHIARICDASIYGQWQTHTSIEINSPRVANARGGQGKVIKADSTLTSSQAAPHPSTNRALCRLISEVIRDPVYSTRCGRQRASQFLIHQWLAFIFTHVSV
jgi:hypothetical protein